MARRRPPDAPSLRRRPAARPPKLRVYIFAEGKNTEPGYFERFAEEHGNSLVKIICTGGAGVPATLVEKAHEKLIRLRRSRDRIERRDQVWIVFDEDEHPQVRQSINRGRALGIHVGYSNPCFELWLLLHHRNHDSPDDRHQVQRKFGECDKNYDGNGAKRPSYELMSANYPTACTRAQAMRERRVAENDPMGCPFTDVDLLTAVIVENGKA